MTHRMQITALLTVVLLGIWCACERESPPPAEPPGQPARDLVSLPPHKAAYSFAPGLAETHPEIVAFMRHFLEMGLAGDYGGYRRLVARGVEPESRSRFERILHAVRKLSVDDITPVELSEVPAPSFLVVTTAQVARDPKSPSGGQDETRRLALLIVREDNEWRLAPAPHALQPERQPASVPSSAAVGPEYPWDEGTDY